MLINLCELFLKEYCPDLYNCCINFDGSYISSRVVIACPRVLWVDIGLRAITTEVTSCMVCQNYCEMYHWQSEHECGTYMMVLRHILAALCEMFSITPIMTDG
jgi:hypothetical protein